MIHLTCAVRSVCEIDRDPILESACHEAVDATRSLRADLRRKGMTLAELADAARKQAAAWAFLTTMLSAAEGAARHRSGETQHTA